MQTEFMVYPKATSFSITFTWAPECTEGIHFILSPALPCSVLEYPSRSIAFSLFFFFFNKPWDFSLR